MIRSHVLICGGTGCTSSGSVTIKDILEKELEAKGIADEIKIVMTGCFGLCALGPVMIVYPEGTFYSRVTPEDVPEIVEEHLLKGRLVQRLVYDDIGGGKMVKGLVPLAEMFGYSTDLRSKTQGRGNYSMFFERYEPVPKSVQEKVLKDK
jgi:(2Fe-2S) ferredoxin